MTLYALPTLSPAVWYEVEQYRVTATSWAGPINQSEVYEPTAFEKLETKYFDDRLEAREVVASSAETGDICAADYFIIPEADGRPTSTIRSSTIRMRFPRPALSALRTASMRWMFVPPLTTTRGMSQRAPRWWSSTAKA